MFEHDLLIAQRIECALMRMKPRRRRGGERGQDGHKRRKINIHRGGLFDHFIDAFDPHPGTAVARHREA